MARITVQDEITDEYAVIETLDGLTGIGADGTTTYHLAPNSEVIEDGFRHPVARAGGRLWLDEDENRYWTC